MRRSPRRWLAVALAAAAVLFAAAPPASAHVTKIAGGLRLTYGWADEPAFTGAPNAVQLRIADRAGLPVLEPGGSLTAEVSFGPARIDLPLVPSGQPGEYEAAVVPTRPGTYAFRISGTVRGRAVDTAATCSDRTFACVDDVRAVEFPAKDPSNGDIAARLARGLPRAEDARSTASTARDLAIAALAVGGLALAAAGWLVVRGRGKTA